MVRNPGQLIQHDVLTGIGILLTTLFCHPLAAETLLHVRAGAHPDQNNAEAAITFEGKYAPPFSPRLEISTRIDRSFNRYENFNVPFIKAEIHFSLLPSPQPQTGDPLVGPWVLQLRPFLSVLNLDRWNQDGARGRGGVNAVAHYEVAPQIAVQIEIAPWLELSKFRANTAGREFPAGGFTEKATVELSHRAVFLELAFSAQQSLRSVWRNDWGVQQRLGYRFSPVIQAGVSHELLTGLLDESTGLLRPLPFYDARRSRVAVFGEFLL